MPQRCTALLLRLREHGVFFFLDMLQDGVHQLPEARVTRHVFRITGPQCRDQLPDLWRPYALPPPGLPPPALSPR